MSKYVTDNNQIYSLRQDSDIHAKGRVDRKYPQCSKELGIEICNIQFKKKQSKCKSNAIDLNTSKMSRSRNTIKTSNTWQQKSIYDPGWNCGPGKKKAINDITGTTDEFE